MGIISYDSDDKELRNKYYESLTMDQWRSMVSVFIDDKEDKNRLYEAIDPDTTTVMWDVPFSNTVIRKGSFLTGCGQIHMTIRGEARERLNVCILPAEFTFISQDGIPKVKWNEEEDIVIPQPVIDVPNFGTCVPSLDVGLHGTKNATWEVMHDVVETKELDARSERIKLLPKGAQFFQEGYAYKVTKGIAQGILRVKIQGGGWTTVSALACEGQLYCGLVFLDRDGLTFFDEDNCPYSMKESELKVDGERIWGFPKKV